MRILIVDDEPALAWSLVSFIEEFGHDVTSLSSGEEALEVLQSQKFDAGIIDLRLPGMTGDKLILEAHSLHPHMVFVIHTGSADYTVSPELAAIGVKDEDVYFKPVADMAILLDGINKADGRK